MPDTDQKRAAANVIEIFLKISLGLAGRDEDALILDQQFQDEFCRGYIFGCCDLISQSNDWGQADAIVLLILVFDRVFGTPNGPALFKRSIAQQTSEIHLKACIQGSREFGRFMSDATPPLGLARHLQLMSDTETEEHS